MKHRLIDKVFPVKEVSEQSSREKYIRHGHISTLHLWWARRPLASSRATAYAALVDPPKNIEEWGTKSKMIAELSVWENATNYDLIQRIRQEILDQSEGIPPRVLDPFGGGGSIPLEVLRLGCETHSVDTNPVSILIQKCILEFPQKYGHSKLENHLTPHRDNPLLKDVKRWSDWVRDNALEEIGVFYPSIDKEKPVGYITARTVSCQNHKCGAEIPLMRSYWLSKKKGKEVAVRPLLTNKEIEFDIVGDGYATMPDNFDPDTGTVAEAVYEFTYPMLRVKKS